MREFSVLVSSGYGGTIDRVVYHESDWSSAPPSMKQKDGDVMLDASQDSPNVISIFGKQFGRLTLLVVPPYTDATDAYTAVTTAANANDASSPEQLLGIGARSAKDHRQARMALHRWETEGGALGHPGSRSRLHTQHEKAADR